MSHCHCSRCRKQHGTLYGTTLGADAKNFRWLSGEQDIVHYRSSPTFERPFCARCGSDVPSIVGEKVVVPAGALRGDPGMRPREHLFVGSKSPVCDIDDDLPQYAEAPGSDGGAVSHASSAIPGESLTGTCLCGETAYALDETPTKLTNCHCTRCQRSRGTAHATNVFVRQGNLRWLRGAALLKTYQVPGAELFTTTFCSECGCLMPSLFAGIKRYNLPVGSLDQALGNKPSLHIFVADRAPWFAITDTLPQFAAMPPRDQVRELMF